MVPQPPPKKMLRSFRLLAALAATLAVATGITYRFVHADTGAKAAPPAPQAVALLDQTASEAPSADDAGYQLDKLPVLSRVIIEVKNNYVDPRRIDPKGMVVAALDMVEKTVAEVMVEGDAKAGKLKVTVGPATQEFDISKVSSIFDVRMVLGDIMGFVQKHLLAHKNLREIEYAATNGLLSTLDPHSVLLEPKFFKEMKLQTRGEFGGLGFVIQMRDGNLTVVKVLKNTPAQRAGVKAKDVITKIEEQSTVNMDLQDAVDHLRGKPNTRVAITIGRTGWNEPKRFGLVREVINVETITQAKLLEKGVGYVKLSQFSANSARDLAAAIDQEKAQAGGALKGLILDLRGNPGGLLDQAIQVSDLFLSEGVIVKTVGEGDRLRIHEVKEAHADAGDLTDLPLVVLVNNSSASASEIVAGALKNNDRALVVGRQTFGKGSVQVLYDRDFADLAKPGEELALKLTIAQYLTPGDISIQEVGVSPDILLLPGRALKDAVNYFAPPRSMGEVDLEHHFSNPTDATPSKASDDRPRERTEKAALELRYLLDEKEDHLAQSIKAEQKRDEARKAREESGDATDLSADQFEEDEADANPDELVEDYPIRFAKDLLARAPYATRSRQLEAAKGFVTERRTEEDARLKEKLEQLGLDWSSGSKPGTPKAVVTVTAPATGQKLTAGATVPWTVNVENKGDGPFRRLRAWTVVDKNSLLDRREFIFGDVKPGEKRSWVVPVKVPRSLDSRRDDVVFHFEEDGGKAPADVSSSFEVLEVPRPVFAFTSQVEDQATGNGDGLPERGEELKLRVDVKNSGTGVSGEKTYVSLKNLGDEKIFIKKGRVVIGALKPGEVKTAELQLEVRKGLKDDKLPLRVMVVDEKLDQYISEKLEIPVRADPPAKSEASGGVRVSAAEAVLYGGADAQSEPLAVAKKGVVLPVNGKFGAFYRVEWQKGRVAFAKAADVKETKAKREGAAAEVWQREPPRIAIAPDPARGAPLVDGDRWRLEGSASVPASPLFTSRQLRDVFVFVNDQKVFFKVVPAKAGGGAPSLDFATDVPLKPGNNVVTIFAREDDEFQTHRTVMVHRRTASTVAQGAAK